MIEFDIYSLSVKARDIVGSYGRYQEAIWNAWTATASLPLGYDVVEGVANEALSKLRAVTDALRPEVENFALSLGAKPHDSVGFFEYRRNRKWLVAHIVIGEDEYNDDL